jgi:hypothetical protein
LRDDLERAYTSSSRQLRCGTLDDVRLTRIIGAKTLEDDGRYDCSTPKHHEVKSILEPTALRLHYYRQPIRILCLGKSKVELRRLDCELPA